MNKGFDSMLEASAHELDREFKREMNGVEVPYMEQSFRNWLLESEELSPNTVNQYACYLRCADRELFLTQEDFFGLLKENLLNGNFDEIRKIFDRYLAVIDRCQAAAKKGELNLNPKVIGDWRSGMKSYRRFFTEFVIPALRSKGESGDDLRKLSEKINGSKPLFAETQFVEWMQDEEVMTYGSAHSYASRLRSFRKALMSVLNDGEDLLERVPLYLKSDHPERAVMLLRELEEIVEYVYSADALPELQMRQRVANARAALAKYGKFIEEEMVDFFADEESEEEMNEEASVAAEVEKAVAHGQLQYPRQLSLFNLEGLKKNFRLRLMTQNRMGDNMQVFYPIGLIRRLFCLSERLSKKNGAPNGHYKWFNRWVDDVASEISIETVRGRYSLADIEFLTIDSTNRCVEVFPTENENPGAGVAVLTHTDIEGADPVQMRVSQLRDIHIDHMVLISKVLADLAGSLPALGRMTEIVKDVAAKHRLPIRACNFAEIGAKVIGNESRFAELEKLIPSIKEELNLIRSKSELMLMAAEYNLRKK